MYTSCIEQSFPHLDHLGIIQLYHPISHTDVSTVRASSMAAINLNPQWKSLTLKCGCSSRTPVDFSCINDKLLLLETLRNSLEKIKFYSGKLFGAHMKSLKATEFYDLSYVPSLYRDDVTFKFKNSAWLNTRWNSKRKIQMTIRCKSQKTLCDHNVLNIFLNNF